MNGRQAFRVVGGTRVRRGTTLAIGLGLLGALAGCGDGGGARSDASRSAEATATAATATSTPTNGTVATKVAAGGLVDGKHFGYIRAFTTGDGTRTMAFDQATWLTGDEATAAARAAGDIGSDEPVPNDYYVTNPDTATVTLPVDPDVTVTRVDCDSGCTGNAPGRIEDLVASFGHEDESTLETPYRGARSQYWVTTAAGVVTHVDEQYVP